MQDDDAEVTKTPKKARASALTGTRIIERHVDGQDGQHVRGSSKDFPFFLWKCREIDLATCASRTSKFDLPDA